MTTMPLYDFECTECLNKFEEFESYEKRLDVKCPKCSGKSQIVFSKRGSVIADEMPPTKHPITGEIFTSKSKFREVTRRHGCVEIGDSHLSDYALPKDTTKSDEEYMRRANAYLSGEGEERVKEINNRMRRIQDEYRSRWNR